MDKLREDEEWNMLSKEEQVQMHILMFDKVIPRLSANITDSVRKKITTDKECW